MERKHLHAIGIRVSAKRKDPQGKVYFAVIKYDDTGFNLIKTAYINIPVSFEVPEQLAFIRTNLLAIIREFRIKYAGLRVAEGSANTQISYRKNIEGVIQELFANSNVEAYDLLLINKFSRIFDAKPNEIKNYIEGNKSFADIQEDEWKKYSKEIRECILAGLSVVSWEEIA